MFISLLKKILPMFRVLAIAFLLTVWIVPGISVTDAAVVSPPRQPNEHEVIWNGRDNKGQAVPSGTYVVGVQAGDELLSEKVTMLKEIRLRTPNLIAY